MDKSNKTKAISLTTLIGRSKGIFILTFTLCISLIVFKIYYMHPAYKSSVIFSTGKIGVVTDSIKSMQLFRPADLADLVKIKYPKQDFELSSVGGDIYRFTAFSPSAEGAQAFLAKNIVAFLQAKSAEYNKMAESNANYETLVRSLLGSQSTKAGGNINTLSIASQTGDLAKQFYGADISKSKLFSNNVEILQAPSYEPKPYAPAPARYFKLGVPAALLLSSLMAILFSLFQIRRQQ